MKSILVEANCNTAYYPALFTKRGAIVMFENDEAGTVVVGTEEYPFGEYSDSFYIKDWQRLPSGSQVILTQD